MASTARSKDRARNNAAIFSVVAIAILIAIPAVVAYAESSDDVIYTPIDVPIDSLRIGAATSGAEANIDSFITTNHGTINYVLDSAVSSSNIHLYFNSIDASKLYKIRFNFDVASINVKNIMIVGDSWSGHNTTFEYNESLGYWEANISAVDRVHWNDSTKLLMNLSCDAFTALNGEMDITFYTANTVFTEDVVETIALISGLLLIVFALFATPWISVSQVTRTARKGARSVKNGAKKATRSVKRSIKKR